MDMDLEVQVESRKKFDQKKKFQKELRDIEKFSCVPKQFQESFKINLQQQLQKRRGSYKRMSSRKKSASFSFGHCRDEQDS